MQVPNILKGKWRKDEDVRRERAIREEKAGSDRLYRDSHDHVAHHGPVGGQRLHFIFQIFVQLGEGIVAEFTALAGVEEEQARFVVCQRLQTE